MPIQVLIAFRAYAPYLILDFTAELTHTKPLLPQGLFIASITPKTPQIKPSIPGTTDNKTVSAFTHPVA